MAIVALIHPQERVEVLSRLLVRKSDLFADNPTLAGSPYTLKSEVSLSDFREFVAALEGRRVTITNTNFDGLSRLCQEFSFQDFGTQLQQFRASGNFKEEIVRLSALEERMDRLAALVERVASAQSAIERVTAPALTQLQDDLTKLKDSMEPLQNDVRALKERTMKPL
jgi:uncharacterized coiled-coil protein SlyX